MAEPLKTFFSRELVKRLAADIVAVYPAFPVRRFVATATRGLDDLELLDRARQIAAALATHLPESYPDALDILLGSLGPEHDGDELVGAGMAPFYYMPHLTFIATHGLEYFDRSMEAQYALTKRFTANSASAPSSRVIRSECLPCSGAGRRTPTLTCGGSCRKARACDCPGDSVCPGWMLTPSA